MSQKKVLLYSPDGKDFGWFMEDVAPAGWVTSDPNKPKEEGEAAYPDSNYVGDVKPGTPSEEQQEADDESKNLLESDR